MTLRDPNQDVDPNEFAEDPAHFWVLVHRDRTNHDDAHGFGPFRSIEEARAIARAEDQQGEDDCEKVILQVFLVIPDDFRERMERLRGQLGFNFGPKPHKKDLAN